MTFEKSAVTLSEDYDQAATLRYKVSIKLLLLYLAASLAFVFSYLVNGQPELVWYIAVPFILPILFFLYVLHRRRRYHYLVMMLVYFFTVMGLLNLLSSPDYLVDLFLMPVMIGMSFLVLKYRHALCLSLYLLGIYAITAAVVHFYEPFDILYTNANFTSVVLGFIVSLFAAIFVFYFFAKSYQESSVLLGNTLLTSQKMNDDNRLLISVISHDFRNYLANLLLQIDNSKKLCRDPQLASELDNIETSVFEIGDLLKEVQHVRELLAREEAGGLVELTFNDILRKLELIFRQQLLHRKIRLSYEARRDFTLKVYPDIFIHLIMANLFANALRFAPADSEIRFEVEKHLNQTCLRIISKVRSRDRAILKDLESIQQKKDFQPDGDEHEKERGLGMIIVRKFCDIHQIDFSFELTEAGKLQDTDPGINTELEIRATLKF